MFKVYKKQKKNKKKTDRYLLVDTLHADWIK